MTNIVRPRLARDLGVTLVRNPTSSPEAFFHPSEPKFTFTGWRFSCLLVGVVGVDEQARGGRRSTLRPTAPFSAPPAAGPSS